MWKCMEKWGDDSRTKRLCKPRNGRLKELIWAAFGMLNSNIDICFISNIVNSSIKILLSIILLILNRWWIIVSSIKWKPFGFDMWKN